MNCILPPVAAKYNPNKSALAAPAVKALFIKRKARPDLPCGTS